MGKVVTLYLSDEEARQLKDFCDENQCTQYSALKTAVKQLLYQPILSIKDEFKGSIEDHQEIVKHNNEEDTDGESNEKHEEDLGLLAKLRKRRNFMEEHNPDTDSAINPLLKLLEKRRQEQEKNSS